MMNKIKNKKLIIKASAGTGKTYTLSLKYIIALCNEIDYKNILVMTFTKKATAEIKEKILERIEELLFSQDNSVLIKNLIENNDNVDLKINDSKIKKLNAIYQDMQKNKDKIKIYTIDSFMNIIFKNIVSKYKNFNKFSTLGEENNKELGTNFYYKKILEEVFKNKNLFADFKEFLFNNSEKDISKYIETIKNLIENRWKYLIATENNENFFNKEKLEIKVSAHEILEKLFLFIQDDCEKNLEDVLKTKFNYLLNLSKEDRKKNIEQRKMEFFDNNPIDLRKFAKKIDAENKEHIKNIYEKIQESLAKEIYNNDILSYEKNLLDFSEKIFNIYDNLKFKEKKFSFSDITLYSYMTIFNKNNFLIDKDKNNKNCGVNNLFFEMLDMKIDAVFIDEFQDTSVLQWKILNEIIKKTEQVICVGDEKQSIYGWRDGEKRLFENLEHIIGAKNTSLNTSYRSDKKIVDYINSIFSKICETYPKWKYKDSSCASEKDGYVKYIYFEKLKTKSIDSKGKETLKTNEDSSSYNARTFSFLVSQIKKLNLNSYDDIAIITRTNKDLIEIANLLEYENIPHTLHKTEEIYENPAIFEFFEFLKFLLLDDDLALFNFISSDLSKFNNLGTKEIEILLKNKEELLNYLNNNSEKNILENNFLNIIKKFKSDKSYKNISATEFIVKFLNDFNFMNIFTTDNNLKNIFEIYLLSKKYDNILEFFKAYQIQSLRFTPKISKEKSKGIELMSIHKSKGLQFKTVFFIELDKRDNNRDKANFLFNMDNSYEETKFSLFYRTKYDKILNFCFPEIFNEYKTKLEEEEINNKYVALTRAKNNLFYISQKSKSVKNSFELGKFSSDSIEEKIEKEKSEEINNDLMDLTKLEFISESSNFESEISKSKFSLETEEKRKLGILIHYFLENIKYATKDEIEFSKKLCYKNYVSYFGIKKLDKIFSDKNMKEIFEKDKEIFSDKWDYIYSEYELYDKENKARFRLDRIMIRDEKIDKDNHIENGEIYIIDYKTGQKNDEQLENYKNLVIKNFPELSNYKIHTKFLDFNIIY